MKLINLFIISFLLASFFCCKSDFTLTEPTRSSSVFLKINAPKDGETWKKNSTHQITWKNDERIKSIHIHLFRKSTLIKKISSNVANIGKVTWQIGNEIPSSHHYKIRLIDAGNANVYFDSPVFFILD